MTYIVPNADLKSAEILKQISEISGTQPDELTIRRLADRAKKIMDVDAAGAHTALGALAAIQGDAEKAKRHHKIALENSGQCAESLRNYSSSLAQLSLYEEAFTVIKSAFEKNREDLSLLSESIDYAVFAGLFSEAKHYLEVWHRQNPDVEHHSKFAVDAAVNLIGGLELDEESLQKALFRLHNVPQHENIITKRFEIAALDDEMTFEISIQAEPEDAVRLNEIYAKEFLEDAGISDLVKSHFTGVYSSL